MPKGASIIEGIVKKAGGFADNVLQSLDKLILLIKKGSQNFASFIRQVFDDFFEWLKNVFKSGKKLDWLAQKVFRFSDDGNSYRNSIRLINRADDNWYNIVTHGSKNGKKILYFKDYIGPEEYAKILTENGWIKDEPIRLVVCYSGSLKNGFAQKLATILKTTVEAPTKRIALNDFGEFVHETGGAFKTFKP